MDKEKATRDLSVKVPPSLFEKFSSKCKDDYKTVSEVIRKLMNDYVKGDNA